MWRRTTLTWGAALTFFMVMYGVHILHDKIVFIRAMAALKKSIQAQSSRLHLQTHSNNHPQTDLNFITDKSIPCIDPNATQFGRVEDIFCKKFPEFIPGYKNPCFHETLNNGEKTLRCLPYFYILGSDKCGTTDLYYRMLKHPQIKKNGGVVKKEASFWSWRRYGVYGWIHLPKNLSMDFYFQMFDNTAQEIDVNKTVNLITGDASPMDLYDFRFWPLIPQNQGRQEPLVLTPHMIKHVHGNHTPKMIIRLRDPVERLFSLYIFTKKGNTSDQFHNDVVLSLKIINTCLAERDGRSCFFDKNIFEKMPVMVHTSCYSVFLKEWFKVFPRSSFHISRLEDASKNMTKTMVDIFNYLEVDPMPEERLRRISRRKKLYITKRKIGKSVLPETALLLREFYKVCNEELAEMLQDDGFLWKDDSL